MDLPSSVQFLLTTFVSLSLCLVRDSLASQLPTMIDAMLGILLAWRCITWLIVKLLKSVLGIFWQMGGGGHLGWTHRVYIPC